MSGEALFTLNWGIDRGGYEIEPIPAHAGGKTAIQPLENKHYVIKPRTGEFEFYNPFNYLTSVAREFSELEIKVLENEDHDGIDIDECEAVRSFANKYGLLGLQFEKQSETKEDLRDWARIRATFRAIYRKVDNYKSGEAADMFNDVCLTRWMTLQVSNGASSSVRQLQMKPVTLLSAMSLMLAEEVTKGTQMRLCANKGCQNWFPISGKKRACSVQCKQAFYRQRKSAG